MRTFFEISHCGKHTQVWLTVHFSQGQGYRPTQTTVGARLPVTVGRSSAAATTKVGTFLYISHRHGQTYSVTINYKITVTTYISATADWLISGQQTSLPFSTR